MVAMSARLGVESMVHLGVDAMQKHKIIIQPTDLPFLDS